MWQGRSGACSASERARKTRLWKLRARAAAGPGAAVPGGARFHKCTTTSGRPPARRSASANAR